VGSADSTSAAGRPRAAAVRSPRAAAAEGTGAPAERAPGSVPEIPGAVAELLATLRGGGHSAYVVGGCLRDSLLGRDPADWDLTTDAAPKRIQSLFPRSLYENRFGTVVVRQAQAQFEITTFRRDVAYTDHRHPDGVEFGDSIDEDLARRDFTVNAMAWGGPAGTDSRFVDPHGGRADLAGRLLRAVGDPDKRFQEDALRMVRAVRLAATLGFEIDPETLASIGRNAELARHLSGERIATELLKLLAAPRPSVGLRLMAGTGLLAVIAPDLARQAGVAQNKVDGEDLWDHTMRTVDAAPNRRLARLASLLHDIGKPDSLADGHFHGHDTLGATMARDYLASLHAPRELQERVAHLIRNHMFSYQANWSDAAVRRFIRKVGPGSIDDLLALRAADNEGSGLSAEAGLLPELERRVRAELAAHVVLGRHQLAIDGHDLRSELGIAPGRKLGRILDALTERVIAEPALNDRAILLEVARVLASGPAAGESTDQPTSHMDEAG
jgi:tRNA nucleotidyltransferase (CCA-adding enzyme)